MWWISFLWAAHVDQINLAAQQSLTAYKQFVSSIFDEHNKSETTVLCIAHIDL